MLPLGVFIVAGKIRLKWTRSMKIRKRVTKHWHWHMYVLVGLLNMVLFP